VQEGKRLAAAIQRQRPNVVLRLGVDVGVDEEATIGRPIGRGDRTRLEKQLSVTIVVQVFLVKTGLDTRAGRNYGIGDFVAVRRLNRREIRRRSTRQRSFVIP